MIYLIGIAGIAFLGLLAALGVQNARLDSCKTTSNACVAANKSLDTDCKAKIKTVKNALALRVGKDAAKAKAAEKQKAVDDKLTAAAAPLAEQLVAIAATPATPTPTNSCGVEVHDILEAVVKARHP